MVGHKLAAWKLLVYLFTFNRALRMFTQLSVLPFLRVTSHFFLTGTMPLDPSVKNTINLNSNLECLVLTSRGQIKIYLSKCYKNETICVPSWDLC